MSLCNSLTFLEADIDNCWILSSCLHQLPPLPVHIGEGVDMSGQVLLNLTGTIHLTRHTQLNNIKHVHMYATSHQAKLCIKQISYKKNFWHTIAI